MSFNSEIAAYVRSELLTWIAEGEGTTSEYWFRVGMILSPDAQSDRDEFDADFSDRGCTCFISPPCSFCVHPGNPRNQEESDECWVSAMNGGAA